MGEKMSQLVEKMSADKKLEYILPVDLLPGKLVQNEIIALLEDPEHNPKVKEMLHAVVNKYDESNAIDAWEKRNFKRIQSKIKKIMVEIGINLGD